MQSSSPLLSPLSRLARLFLPGAIALLFAHSVLSLKREVEPLKPEPVSEIQPVEANRMLKDSADSPNPHYS